MTTDAPYDARGIANLLLDRAEEKGLALTNLSLQKLLYFAHAIFLKRKGLPLVVGYFEAWQYGPVHPSVYQAFKSAENTSIKFRASKVDLRTGETTIVFAHASEEALRVLDEIILSLGPLSPSRLVEMSHAKGAPWDYIMNKENTSVAFGMRIGDNVILERFRFHKTSLAASPLYGEHVEETPPT